MFTPRIAACVKTLLSSVLLALMSVGASAQTGDVVVSTSTSWPAGAYSLTSLTVQGGAVLSIGGGSTVTVANGIKVSGSSSVVLQGANTATQVSGAWAGVGVTLQAGSVQVDAGSSINADAQGYVGNAGPGYVGGSAGSYGGLGGGGYATASAIYGSASMPVELGSGGSNAQYAGSNGGGAIRLIVSGTLTINGVISANGEIVEPGRGGAGSGGSIYVTAGSLTGSGSFTANGGANTDNAQSGSPAGGGGRVAVYYGSASGFSGLDTSKASGGTDAGNRPGYSGMNGTAIFVNTSVANGGLTVSQAYSIPANSIVSYDSITVQNGAVLTIGGGSMVTVANAVTVTGKSSIVMQGTNNTGKVNNVFAGVGVTLQAGSVQVDSGSSISADGQGYFSSARRAEDGGGVSGGSGGSYGGLGGYQPGPIYGSAAMPVDLGSGGAGAQYFGSNGGGAIHLIVSGTLTNNGTISANGQAVLPSQGGAGAGGSVYVQTATLVGSGSFTANGGPNTNTSLSGSAAGGGGRVAIYYANGSGFTGFTSTTASGGTYAGADQTYAGANGTAAFFDTSVTGSNISVYQDGFQVPANTNTQYNSLTVANGAAVNIGSGSTISVATTLNVGGASVLTVGGGTTLNVSGALNVTGNSTVVVQSANNAGKVNAGWAGVGATISAGSVQVDAGSAISADGQGYLSSARRDEITGVAGGSGGSYGGLGGYYPGPVYGSAAMPVDLGSGGVAAQYFGSNGGGAIRLIVTGTLTNNGTISANGQPNIFCTYGGCGGGGAGGSVYVTTATLAGSGSFTANGGSNTIPTNNGSAAGGGGRVAVYYAGPTTFSGFTASTASGGVYTGTQTGFAGANGTAAFFDTSSPKSNVSVYQHFEVLANSSAQYNSLTVAKGATVTVGGGALLAVTQALRVTGAITALSTNNTATINGKWLGKGVVLAAGSLQIDSTGSISADAQGYPANSGPGGGTYTAGGSYGGLGAIANSGGGNSSGVYGSKTAPVDLGSGGGGGQNTGGGSGGGAIELLVAGTLTNNGTISANGQSIATSGYGGGGSGGSVFVQTNTLSGTGTISANGGSNTLPVGSNAGGGGGGGRISVNYLSSGINQSALSVNPGTGAATGNPGTINFVQAAALQLLQPINVAVHGVANLEWFSDSGVSTTVNAAGPQSSVIATGGMGLSNATWDTTRVPDGAYELRLTATDASGGTIASISKDVVVNNSVTWVSGTLTANTHWTANHVYAIEGDLIIPSGITLTIDPGTVVKSLANYQILVQSGGTLTALGGDTTTPVIFTTFDDASAGGNTSFGVGSPQAGEWAGISVGTGGTLNTNVYTFVRYGRGALGSTITANTTLFSSQAYEISGTLTVQSGASLTIQPGTVIKFDAGAGITVDSGGALFANGTLAQPIYFTSINDQTVGANLISQTNPNATLVAPAPGDWNSININGTATFSFAHILYGGGPIPTVTQTGMLDIGGGATAVTVNNSTLAYSYYIGIEADAGTLSVSNSIFYANQDRAINNFGTVHIVNSTFDGNFAGPFNHGGTMDMANSVVTGFTSTQFGGTGGAISPFLNNDIYTATPGVPLYIDMTDPTGTNGNISASPVYMNGPQHDYRPTYGSPLIDAGNGTVANYPTTDAFNDPRYNAPLVTVKKGMADTSGNYPDIGAFEFVQSAPSDLDLTVSAVQGPASAVVGTQVQVKWTVTNVGVGTVYGPWHDAIYLVKNPGTNPTEIYAGQVLSGQNVILGSGATYSGTATVTVPGAAIGEYSWEVKTNVLGEVFEGANSANNKAFSLDPVQVDVPALTAGAGPIGGSFVAAGQAAYYKIIPSATQTTRVQLALVPPAAGSVQLFVGSGYIPTPQHYDYQQVEFDSASATVVIPAGSALTYYVTAYPQVLATTPAAFTISASTVAFSLTSVSPNRVPADGNATLTFVGGGFTSNTVFKLVGATSGTAYTATSVFLSDSDTAQVTFQVSQFASDEYTAEAIDGSTVTLANAVYILEYTQPSNISSGGILQTFLRVPQAFRVGFPSQVYLEYNNISGADLPAPMVAISSDLTLAELAPQCDDCSPNLPAQFGNAYTAGLVLAINHTGAAGVLPAGGSGTIPFLATAPNLQTGTDFEVSTDPLDPIAHGFIFDCSLFPDGTIPENCAAGYKSVGAYATGSDFCASLTPAGASAAAYTRACMLFLNKAGFSYVTTQPPLFAFNGSSLTAMSGGQLPFTGFNKVLANDATALSTEGTYEYDVSRLLAYEFQVDGSDDFAVRYHQGAYGYGASHPFDITLSVSAGAPVVTYPDGSTRAFVTPSPTLAGTYLGPVGDYGTIAQQADSSWLLTEPTGTIYHFLPSTGVNPLDYVQDRTGNRTTLTYTGNFVTKVTDAFGNSASLQYDGNGHIVSYTSPSGQVTTYGYTTLADTQKSTFLTSVTDSAGTTTMTWNQGGSHGVGYIDDTCITTYCEPAIGVSSITYPDGTHDYYTYDAAGRLTRTYHDNGTEEFKYTYNENPSFINDNDSTTITDATGKSSTIATNVDGLPTAVTDPLGNIVRFRYNAEDRLETTIGPLGDSGTSSYDMNGNLANITSPSGNTTSLSFGPGQNLASIADPNGNAQKYTYDSGYNQTGLAYPNGSQALSTYDAQGRLLTHTNRRGNTTTFSYLPNGLMTSKTFANGSQVLFSYDAHRNLKTLTTAGAVTTYEYDSADRATKQTNPDGTFLQYVYNAGGQRIRMIDSTGFVTNYSYDSAGRMSGLTDGSGASIVSYSFDADGRVSTKTLGNGTSTNYSYDPTGNLLSIVNRTRTNAVLSEYDYTYDAEGNPLTQSTPAGTSTYTYDPDGQLVSAAAPSGTTQYTYDAAGNRSQVVDNGATITYQGNNLNQYVTVGTSNYQYDADGNLTSGDGWTYGYDDENHLVSMTNGSDSWTYQYDGLSQRIGSVHNGVATHYLIDSLGFENITAELNSNGQPTVHYTYGLDLVSSVPASGTPSYYHFDGTGNTTQMTSATGAVVNNYSYKPFGEVTVLAASVTNPFTYNGRQGVRAEGSGLYFMRNRWYNPALGRFQQLDPAGLADGTNEYRYADNSPVKKIDALGLLPGPVDYFTGSISAYVSITVSVNAHTGECFIGIGPSSGIGGNVAAGSIVTSHPPANRGDYVSDFLGGDSVNAGGYAGRGGGVTTSLNSGVTAVEAGYGGGGKGVAYSHSVSTNSTFVQHVWGDVNNWSGGRLFGTDPSSPFGPRVPKPPLPGMQPIIPCRKCLFKPGKKTKGKVQRSIDPNSKMTSGFGDQGFVPSGVPISYTITFENQPTATLPAQKVVVTDALAANLDWSTVQLNEVNFNNVTLTVPDGTQTYSTQANVSSDTNPVSVKAALNPATGVLTWTIQSVDSITGGTPANPLSGFLPPNNSASAGVGYVTFSVMPKKNLANATSITNQASIVFDVNAPINTNTVTNTIDLSAPTSAVDPLPASTTNPTIPVSWTGNDPSGSGIASYNIYVSIDGGTYGLWLSGTTLTSSNYSAYKGHTFAFISMATDNVGTYQTTPGAAQTVAVVSGALTTPTVTVTPAASSISSAQMLSVGITVSSSSTPTGTVVLSSGTYTSPAIVLAGGGATIMIPAGVLATGADTLTATYTPDTASSTLFTTASGIATVAVAVPTVQVAVGTTPLGATFSVDGTSYTTAQVLTWTIGSTHTLATISPQTANGTQQTFSSWTDGGALSHTVTAAAGTTAYTATFSTAYLLTVAATPAAGGTVTPATGTYYPAGTAVALAATPAAGYTFGSWTGTVASPSSASTTVTMNAPQTVTANFSVVVTPVVSVSPGSLTFASTNGVATAAQNVTVKNTGNGPLTISGITLGGAGAATFAQTNTCGTSLAAGGSCNVAVTFTPSSVSSFSATLSIADTATGSPQTVSLTGTGTAAPTFTVSATPPSQDVVAGTNATYTVSVTPQGGAFTGAVALTVSGLPSGATATFSPASVTPGSAGAQSTLTVSTPTVFAGLRETGAPVLALAGCLLLAVRKRRRLVLYSLLIFVSVAGITALTGCGSTPHTATYTVTITGTSGSQAQTTTVKLTLH